MREDDSISVSQHALSRDTSQEGAQRFAYRPDVLSELAAIVESATEAIIGKSLDGKITFWNDAAEQIFGYSAAEARLLSPVALLTPDRLEEETDVLNRIQRGEIVGRFETVRMRKDGRLVDVSVAMSPIKDAAGVVIGASVLAHDITEWKTATAKLQRVEDLYRKSISSVGGVPYLYDNATRSYAFMGGGIMRLIGYSPDEMSPDLWPKITVRAMMLGPAAGMTRDEAIRGALAGEIQQWHCDSSVRTKQGQIRWISDTAIPDFDETGRFIGSIGILQDITDRKLVEQALRESEERFRRVVESQMMGIIFWDSHGGILDANDKFLQMVGYAREEIGAGDLDWNKMTPPEYRALDEKGLEDMRLLGFCQPFEKEYYRKDGSRIPVLIGSATLPGVIDKGVSFVLDITERRRAENRLSALSRLGQDLSSAATPREAAGVIAKIAQDLFGWDALTLDLYSAEDDTTLALLNVDTVAGDWMDVSSGSARAPASRLARRVMTLGAELVLKEEPLAMQPESRPFGDTSRPSASIMRVPIRYRAQPIGVLTIHAYSLKAYDQGDLTALQTFADYCAGALERIRVEEKMVVLHTQLLNTARRAGMEEVASSVLHNVGNVLNSVNVSATVVMDNLRKPELRGLARACELFRAHAGNLGAFLTADPQGRQLPEYLEALAQFWERTQDTALKEMEALNRNISHVKSIISRQQSFSGNPGLAEPVHFSDLLEDALAVGAPDLERLGVVVTREYTMHFPIILDKMRLMLILVNLISNARDALLSGTETRKKLKLRTETLPSGRSRIVIQDNGAGIASENLDRIFSHGFTTKKTGHGFGLHSSALAARELGGALTVQSEGPEKGAAFALELPLKPVVKKIIAS